MTKKPNLLALFIGFVSCLFLLVKAIAMTCSANNLDCNINQSKMRVFEQYKKTIQDNNDNQQDNNSNNESLIRKPRPFQLPKPMAPNQQKIIYNPGLELFPQEPKNPEPQGTSTQDSPTNNPNTEESDTNSQTTQQPKIETTTSIYR